MLDDLKESCEEYVIQEISIDNVAIILINADRWQVSTIRNTCLDLSIKEFDEVSITAGFLQEVLPRHDLVLEIFRGRVSP
jgi:hypothetical protein